MHHWSSIRNRSWLLAAWLLIFCAGAVAAEDLQLGLDEFTQGRFAEALEDWQAEAAAGDATAALYVGVLYDSGQGVAQDFHEALTWYQRAADLGSAVGAFNVGVLYDVGQGTAPDPKQAAFWYSRAATAGFPRAEYNLALLYESGTGVPRDRARAISLFRSAAAHGLTAARAHLISLGETTPRTIVAPVENSMSAFQQAQHILLTRGPADAAKVAALFLSSAQRHNPLAEYDYGYCLEHGLGVPADPAQALTWYERSAADASDDALRRIAKASAANLQKPAPPQPAQTAPKPPADDPNAPPLSTAHDPRAG